MNATAMRFIAAALVAALLFGAGWMVRGWHDASTSLADLEELFDEQQQLVATLRAITDDAAAAREAQQQFHLAQRVRLTEWLLAPDPADGCRVGDNGLWLWNAANAGSNAGAAAGGAAGAVPPPAPSTRPLREDAGRESRGSDGAAGRLRPAPARAGGVGRGGE